VPSRDDFSPPRHPVPEEEEEERHIHDFIELSEFDKHCAVGGDRGHGGKRKAAS